MKTTRYDGRDARRVLAGMATDRTVLARVASRWQRPGLFDAPWANLVGGWCVDYLAKYGSAPNGQITPLFEQWAVSQPDEKLIEAVERFLRFVSREYGDAPAESSDYILDVADKYFNKVRLQGTVEQVQDDLARGDVADALGRLESMRKVELGFDAVVDPATDHEAWRRAYDTERTKSMIEYPGDLGRFTEGAFARSRLIAFMAPDKVGKSWFELDLAYRALRVRRRVAFFDVGDMGESEVMQRLGQRAEMLPLKPGRILLPTGFDDDMKPIRESRQFDEAASQRGSQRAVSKVCRGRSLMRISCHPNSTLSVAGMESILDDWDRRDDWRPDVVVADYADILAPPSGVKDTLDQIDETWKALRRLSQARHCLVVTATQANAAAYSNKGSSTLGRRNFSGRKTKLAHANGIIGLNQTGEEKGVGVVRLNWVVRREGWFREGASCLVAGCLSVGRPVIASIRPRKKVSEKS